MNQMPVTQFHVGAVVPVYNGAAFIRDALESILAQTYPVTEIVVVDDGSTDETAAIVATYASMRVRFIQQHQQGPSAARNRGLADIKTDLVAFLDADDIWLPDKLEKQVALFQVNPQLGLVTCDTLWWNVERGTRHPMSRGIEAHVDQRREIAVRNYVGNTSHVVAQRSLLNQVGGFDAQLRSCEDWELWSRLIHLQPMGIVHEPLLLYRWHSGGHSHHHLWGRDEAALKVAFRAISRVQPAWWRLILLSRAIGEIEYRNAYYAVTHDLPRYQQFGHALLALLCAPFAYTSRKLGYLVQALFGKQAHSILRRWFKQKPYASV